MKKVIFFLGFLFSVISFTETCNWVSDPDIFVRKQIEIIRKNNLESKVYCDVEDTLMVYYLDNDFEELEIGLLYNKKEKKELTVDEFIKISNNFFKELNKIRPVNLTNSERVDAPKYYNYRLYIYNPDEKEGDIYMFLKATLDTSVTSPNWSKYYNKEFFEKDSEMIEFFKKNGIYPTEDIVY